MPETVSMETRERILRVAADEVRHNPVVTVSMQMIADRAGVTKSSLYKAYANKYELFAHASHVVLLEKIAEITDARPTPQEPLEALRYVLAAFCEVGRDQPFALGYLYGSFPLVYHGQASEEIIERVQGVEQEAYAVLRHRIQDAVDAGALDGDVDRLAAVSTLQLTGYITGSLRRPPRIEPEDFVEHVIRSL